ncbi:MAG: translocation/assembly module TamB, partial [Bacteroidia bacterium]|nr:translocation/assembly module TamB [Bacteroidia bacterium]
KNFILNRSNWSIPNDNAIHWRNDRIDFREFTVTRNEQSISIEDFYANDKWDNINVIFKDFNLNTFSSLINNEKLIAEGLANGIFRIYNINESPGFVADLKVRDLVAMDVSLGTLDLVGEVGEEDQYKLKAALSGSNVDVTLDGIYMPRADYEQLNFNLVYNKLDFQSFEILFSKYLNDISGLISGSARVYGNVASPKYKGSINFEKTQFKIKALESTFILPDESVLFSDRKVDLNNLTVWDTDGNDFQINGDISLSNYLNPAFQLTIDGRDLQLLNTKAGHNDKYYGIVYADTKLTVNGTLQDPIIRGDIRINENSDFTYIVPESAIEVQERNGIVLFVNKDDGDQDMVNNIHKLQTKKVLGLDVYTTIQIHPKSTLNIIIDRRTDDRLQVSGEGDLNFRIETNGQATIFGRYDVAQGFYSASLYNLVKRRFDLVPGSNIIWKGDPLDIDMNIQAIYEVEADAREMMALNLGYSTSENRDEISQKVPLQIYLQLNGSLIQPRLSFRLDISEEHKGDLNGRLYNQILSLNQREDELNKQVFSLLVFNQLFPTGSNDGSGGGYLNLARDNMNKLLESQLNKFSDKIFGKAGIELGFNLNRYMDYQNDKLKSTTQLDIKAKKRFLDNRLSIEVSSGINVKTGSQILQSTPAVGNVSLEYILTDDGKLRIKGFRKSQYDNIIDGQLYVIGIALVFQREFEKFKNLWQKTLLVNEIGTKNDDR